MKLREVVNLIAHEIMPRKCIENAVLDEFVMKCKKCGEPIAICCIDIVVPLSRFKRFKSEIIKRRDEINEKQGYDEIVYK